MNQFIFCSPDSSGTCLDNSVLNQTRSKQELLSDTNDPAVVDISEEFKSTYILYSLCEGSVPTYTKVFGWFRSPNPDNTLSNNNNNLFMIPTSPKCFSVGSCKNYVQYNTITIHLIKVCLQRVLRYASRGTGTSEMGGRETDFVHQMAARQMLPTGFSVAERSM